MSNDEFSYNLWNLFNHTNEVQVDRHGKKIIYSLDGLWKVRDATSGQTITTLEAAVDMAAWLNRGEYVPDGR